MTPTERSESGLGATTGILFKLPAAIAMWTAIILGVMSSPWVLQAQSAPQVVLTIGSSLDAASTIYALRTNPNAKEANPILGQGGTAGLVVGKVATTSALVWIVGAMQKNHPVWAKVIGYGGGAALSGLAARNLSVARK